MIWFRFGTKFRFNPEVIMASKKERRKLKNAYIALARGESAHRVNETFGVNSPFSRRCAYSMLPTLSRRKTARPTTAGRKIELSVEA